MPSRTLVDEVADWLMESALGQADMEALVSGCIERLGAAGLPFSRVQVAYSTLHPLFGSVILTWERGSGIKIRSLSHVDAWGSEAWLNSPFYHMIEAKLPFLRRRITGDQALLDFPILKEFSAAGGADYLAYVVPFGGTGDKNDKSGILGSWLTDREGGFDDSDIQALLRIQQRLAVACKIAIQQQTTENIVNAYLGKSPGRQVLNGSIRRGDGEDIHAVIWFCDLRQSSRLTVTLGREKYLVLLNGFLECMAGAVMDNGGEVLRFIGDAALAIFPIAEKTKNVCSVTEACEKALAAVKDAQKRLGVLNDERRAAGEQPLDFGIALHVGDVMFGNIGSPERIEFTVIGTAANEAARIEGLCKKLKIQVLVSAAFAGHYPGKLDTVGRHVLEGHEGERELFTLEGGG